MRQVTLVLRVPAPDVQQGDEVRLGIDELAVGLVGGVGVLEGTVARVLHGQRRRDDQHLAQAPAPGGRQQHARQPRVDGQPGHLLALRRQVQVLVDGAQLRERVVPGADRAALGRFDERELLDRPKLEGLHLEDYLREVRAEDLRLRELLARAVVFLAVQPEAHARSQATGAALALVGRGAGDRLDGQPRDPRARVEPLDARQPRVDHGADARHRQGSLRDVRREHDAPLAVLLEQPHLLVRRQPRVQGQDLDPRRVVLAQRLGRLADLTLPGEEHQAVARAVPGRRINRAEDRRLQVGRRLVVLVARQRGHVHDIDRVRPARDHHDRRGNRRPAGHAGREVVAEALRIDGRGRDDDLQVGPAREQLAQVPQQEIDVEAAFMGLVDDDGVVRRESPVGLRLGQQDAVGHQLDVRLLAGAVPEADLVTDRVPQGRVQFLRDPRGDRPRGDPARLRVPDEPRDPAAQFQADLGELRGLPRAGLAAQHDHLVGGDRGPDLLAHRRDRQLLGVPGPGDLAGAQLAPRDRVVGQRREPRELGVDGARTPRLALELPHGAPDAVGIGDHATVEPRQDGPERVGHARA